MKHDLSKTKEQLIAELDELRKQSKRREEELEKSRRDLLDAQKMAKIGNWSYDILEDKSTWSEEMFRIFDISPQRGALSWAEHRKFIHPDDLKELDELMQNAVKDGKDYKKQFRIVRNNKGIKWVQTIGHAIKNDKGKTVKLFGTIQDITERKHSEDRVSELKEFNESIVSNLAEGIILENDNGIIQFANPAMLKMLGYKEGELLGKHWNCFVPDDQIEAVKNANKRRKKGESDQYEMQLVRKDGERIFVLVRGTPNVNKGKYIGLLATFTDITERKQAEEALRESEEKFSTFMDTAYDLMSITDKDGRFTYVNQSMINKLEYSRDELIGKHITEILTKEAIEKDFQPNWPVFLGNGKLNIESTLLTKSGNIIDCILKAVAIYDKDDNFIGSRAVISDITERKKTEEKLKEKNEQFETIIKSANLGWWDWNIINGDEIYNNILTENLGYKLNEIEPHIKWWEDKIHPDDAEQVYTDLQKHFDNKTEFYKNKHRLKTKCGQWKWFLDFGKVVERDDKGNPTRMIGTLRDIDDEERAQEKIQSSLQQIEIINANTPNIIWKSDIDKQGNFINTYISEVVDEFLALPKNEY